ncbi:Maf-like protein [Synergistales bacterium]|nr:Maf-like protein [Synergistales bacterium]
MLGYDFDIVISEAGEERMEGESPRDMALRLASLKAEDVSRGSDALTIGADTVVDVDGNPFGKPAGREDAVRMLRILSGRAHLVHTGTALALRGEVVARHAETTKVFFGDIADDEIMSLVGSGEVDDKAGAYAIQGRGALMVERIEGCYYNVMGLPAYRLNILLKSFEL